MMPFQQQLNKELQIFKREKKKKQIRRGDALTLATIRWKATSSSSNLSFPFPNFLSAIQCFFFLIYKDPEQKTPLKFMFLFLIYYHTANLPLGSLRLVYSRTSLPAMFQNSKPETGKKIGCLSLNWRVFVLNQNLKGNFYFRRLEPEPEPPTLIFLLGIIFISLCPGWCHGAGDSCGLQADRP